MKPRFGYLPIFLFISLNVISAEPLPGIWREGAPNLKHAGKFNLILDKGEHKVAVLASDGLSYLFSAVGAGSRPLIIVGTPIQIIQQIKHESDLNHKINNQLIDLPDIYLGIDDYQVGERFEAIYPYSTFVDNLVKGCLEFVPGTTFSDVSTNIVSFIKNIPLQKIKEKFKERNKSDNFLNKILYLKITYLPDNNLTPIGKKMVYFKDILGHFEINFKGKSVIKK